MEADHHGGQVLDLTALPAFLDVTLTTCGNKKHCENCKESEIKLLLLLLHLFPIKCTILISSHTDSAFLDADWSKIAITQRLRLKCMKLCFGGLMVYYSIFTLIQLHYDYCYDAICSLVCK